MNKRLRFRFRLSTPSVGGGGGSSSLLFDGFENGLDGMSGSGVAPDWAFVDVTNASIGDVEIVTTGPTPVSGTHTLSLRRTVAQPPQVGQIR